MESCEVVDGGTKGWKTGFLGLEPGLSTSELAAGTEGRENTRDASRRVSFN